jgi:hypothetical protein
MAKTLSKTGITTGNTVEAFHVTQSIDAFSGTDAYDITLSGSLIVSGSVSINSLEATAQNNVVTYNTSTGKLFYTASSTLDTTVDTSSFVTNDQTSSFIVESETGSFYISSSAVLNVITFNQGNGTTDIITVDTGSSTLDTSSFVTNDQTSSFATNASTASLLITASHIPLNTSPFGAVPGNIRFTKGDNTTTFNVTTGKTWLTCSGTTMNVPSGSYGIYINYTGSGAITFDLTGSNIGDEVEIISGPKSDGQVTVDYDTGLLRCWFTQSVAGGSFTFKKDSINPQPTMKWVYIGGDTWHLSRYMDARLGGDSGVALDDVIQVNAS